MPARLRADAVPAMRLLLVDQDQATTAAVEPALAKWFGRPPQVVVAQNGRSAADLLRAGTYHLVVVDLPSIADVGGGVEDAVSRLVKLSEGALVVAISGESSVSATVAAMRAGAHDVVTRPIDGAVLASRIGELAVRHGKDHVLAVEPGAGVLGTGSSALLGPSSQMRFVAEQIDRAASSSAPVFITGEPGTGKGLCAEALHEHSSRAGKRFVAFNCAVITREMLEAELFGVAAGALSGAREDRAGAVELAAGGTLFLDEVGCLDLSLQSKLLRLLQSGSFNRVGESGLRQADVRLVCSTSHNPMQLIAEKAFREDLFYRLHVLPIHLPPLRQRPADILPLARHFLDQYAQDERKRFSGLSADVSERLAARDWPGNVHELKALMQRVVVMFDGGEVTAGMMEAADAGGQDDAASREAGMRGPILPMWRQEQRIIEDAVARCAGNVALAAAALEVSPSTIYRKRQAWAEMGEGRGAA